MSTLDRKIIEKQNRREFILKVAENIMSVQGLHGLSVDLIASETQLAKGTIYLYFKSKEEILTILTMKAREMLFKDFEKIEKKKTTPVEKLKDIIKANYFFYKKNPLYYDLMSLYEANNKHTETEEMAQWSEKITHLVRGIAQKGVENGTINPDLNLLHLTMIMWGATVGVLQLIKVRGTLLEQKMGIEERNLLNTYIEIFEKGIRK